MNTFYSEEELKELGIKKFGKNVHIGRHAVLYSPETLEIGNNVRIDDFTIISGKVILHDFIHVAHFCGMYGGDEGIEMEDFTALSSKVSVYAITDYYDGTSLTNPSVPLKYKRDPLQKKVTLRRHVIIGTGSTILPGVEIGEGSSVGSMGLCTKSLDPWGIYVGIPVKRTRDRSKELLKSEEQLLRDIADGTFEV